MSFLVVVRLLGGLYVLNFKLFITYMSGLRTGAKILKNA